MASRSFQKTKRIFIMSAIVLLGVGMFGVTWAWLYGGNVARGIVQTKLQAIVSGHLNAQLEIGDFQYEYPLGVIATDVALVSVVEGEPPITLASFKQMRLQLDKLPMSEGPLSIRRIEVDEPTIHLVRENEGFVAVNKLVRGANDVKKLAAPKLSEVFHLRHLKLTEARVEYEDRRVKDSVPLVWEHLNLTLDSKPADKQVHTFQFQGQAGDLANIATAGSIDLDGLVLTLDQFTLNAVIADKQPKSPLPPAIQKIMSQFGVSGTTQLSASGWIPLRDPKNSKVDATFTIADATAVLPESGRAVEGFSIEQNLQLNGSNVWGRTSRLAGRSKNVAASVQPFEFTVNLDDKTWSLSEVRAAIVYRPDIAPESWKTQPATLELVAARKSGPSADPMEISLDGTKLTFDALNQTLALNATLRLERSAIRVAAASITGFGGTLVAQGVYDFSKNQTDLTYKIETIDLEPVKAILLPTDPDPIAGHVSGEGRLVMTEDELSTLVITGGLAHLRDGRFGRVPLFASISKTLGIGEDLFIAEKADAAFTIRDSIIDVERVSIRTKAFKIAGKGNVKFDRNIDLNLYAAASGDWGKNVKETGIPLLSDLGGAIVSGTQTVINGVSSQVSAMHVTGTLQNPKIRPDPAPLITDPIKNLFSRE